MLIHTGPECISFPQTPPLPDASPALCPLLFIIGLGLAVLFFFLSRIKRRKKYFLYYVKNQKEQKIYQENHESRSMFLWGREKYSLKKMFFLNIKNIFYWLQYAAF